MKKILLLTIIALFLNGCRYINTKNDYLDAKESKPLVVPANLDMPNSTSELDVPKANSNNNSVVDSYSPPPEMPVRTKQSQKGNVRIENAGGYPELSVKTEIAAMWVAMKDLEIENWSTKNTNQDKCEVTLYYNDLEAREREKSGFLRKLFRRDSLYTDYSGDYNLTCEKRGSLVITKFAKDDGSKAKTYLADNVMNALFDKFK